MDKRQFLFASFATSLTGLSGCITDGLYKSRVSVYEKVSTVAIAQDRSKLVVLGQNYHYVFDEPRRLFEIVSSDLKSKLSAHFKQFIVERDGSLSGDVVIQLRDADEAQVQQAIALGFTPSGQSSLSFSATLKGKRFIAPEGTSQAVATQSLNRRYYISVKDKGSYAKVAAIALITPVTVAADGVLLIASLPLVPLFLPLIIELAR